MSFMPNCQYRGKHNILFAIFKRYRNNKTHALVARSANHVPGKSLIGFLFEVFQSSRV
jgi:hypothetical protein